VITQFAPQEPHFLWTPAASQVHARPLRGDSQ